MKRTILIMEDSPLKAWRVKEEAEKRNFRVIITPAVETAKAFLEVNEVDAIITDNSCFLNEGKEPQRESKAGELLLTWLKENEKEIPVLGNSLSIFKTDYPHYWGQMVGFFDGGTFDKFISSLKKDQG